MATTENLRTGAEEGHAFPGSGGVVRPRPSVRQVVVPSRPETPVRMPSPHVVLESTSTL